MNSRSIFFRLIPVFLLCASSAFSQEAIEKSTRSTEEPATVEPTPVPNTEEAPASTESKPKVAKRVKEKSTEEHTSRDLQDSMTAQEFKAAGLDKLSPEELKALNAKLQGIQQKAETKAAEVAVKEEKKKSKSLFNGEAVIGRVNDDNFAGVSGKSIIHLEDGTVWKQVNSDDRFNSHYTNHPPARVTRGPFGYKMFIVGTGEFYVNPVR